MFKSLCFSNDYTLSLVIKNHGEVSEINFRRVKNQTRYKLSYSIKNHKEVSVLNFQKNKI